MSYNRLKTLSTLIGVNMKGLIHCTTFFDPSCSYTKGKLRFLDKILIVSFFESVTEKTIDTGRMKIWAN